MIGLMRVKNEERWIERAVKSLLRAFEKVVVMDDHSTDKTPEICLDLGCLVYRSPFADMDEARDKTWLVQQAYKAGILRSGAAALMIDGDEELVAGDEALIESALAQYDSVALRVLYLWDDEHHIRTDGVYGRFWRPSAWICRSAAEDSFVSIGSSNRGLHCSNVPARCAGRSLRCHARLLHYGYMLREDRERKYRWYNSIDPGNAFEDCYRHMVIGDLFPAASRFRHAGPLEVQPWLCD